MLEIFPDKKPKKESKFEKAMAFVSVVMSVSFGLLILSVAVWILSKVF